ncbi:cadherin repeat domain-containing protein [Fulvivirga sp. M361]|uniref:spondin domain-containing protein n=1 Tax=Fulvivirga sp. M361 TaxID=2594266 RepID=UPI00117B44EB|nr:spondin domain-containing protein [Fulvivirga sp. M361]TRX49322.1 cadherin repeat domain-containing protein [Fulvivirga sp. M361]
MKKTLLILMISPLAFLFSCGDDDESINLPPSFSGAVFSVLESATDGMTIGTLSASDPESGTLTFSITGGNTGDAFALDAGTGELTVNSMDAIDFESALSFNLDVTVSDGINTVSGLVVVNVGDDVGDNPTTFRITVYNTINYLNTVVFNTPDGAAEAGPIAAADGSYSFRFKATPGTNLSFATMQAMSNDWFFAPDGDGITLFDGDKKPLEGDITGQLMLWDSGNEEEDPAAWASADPMDENGMDDDNTSVRLVKSDVTAYISAYLEYDMSTSEFEVTITNLLGGAGGVVITPGLAIIHAQDYPLFKTGMPDRGFGLKEIAEDGNPQVLYDYFNEQGTAGAPLRLSSSYSPLAPGVAYVFPGAASDPLFTQGQPEVSGSGLELLAEDGSAATAVSFLNDNGIKAVAADQMAPVFPGEKMTFTIEAKPGYKFGYATMLIETNDWFISFNNAGVELFNADGTPKSGMDYSIQSYLYDSGTEEDQPVGVGADQAPRQAGGNTGAADDDTSVRRVAELDDVQFGKGLITSSAGVVSQGDPRGGYNLVLVDIEPLN